MIFPASLFADFFICLNTETVTDIDEEKRNTQ